MSSEASAHSEQSSSHRSLIIIIVVIVIIAIALFFVFRGKTTTTKGPGTDYPNSSTLSCSANNIDNGIFYTSSADTAAYDFSIIFHDDQLYNLTYNFEATYANEPTAINAEAELHADIGKYLQDHGSSLEALSSNNFSVNGNQVKFSIAAAAKDITAQSAPVFMIDVADTDTSNPKIPNTLKEIKSNYTTKGFICKEQD